jgi:hypothetical protein
MKLVSRMLSRSSARPTPRRKLIALAIAGAADLAQLALAPLFAEGALSPFDTVLDLVTAAALLATLGWQWRTALALTVELIPGVALFPSWTAMIVTLPVSPAEAAPRRAALAPNAT